jgi:hypothetical protein
MPTSPSHVRFVRLDAGPLGLGANPRIRRAFQVALLVSVSLYVVLAVATGLHSVPSFIMVVVVFLLLNMVVALGYLFALWVLPARWLQVCVALGMVGLVAAEASFASSWIPLEPATQALGTILPVTQALGIGTAVAMGLAISHGLGWVVARKRAEAEGGEGGVADSVVRLTPAAPPRIWRLGTRRHP